MPLLIVSPMFPPMEGGLPDHTDRLAHALSEHFRVTVLTSVGMETARAFPVHAVVEDWQDADRLTAAINRSASDGPVLWQYVPHMYGRGGVNFAVPRALRRLHLQGRRQVVLAHEIAAPWSWLPHRSWYAFSHRRMWRGIRASADAVGVSTAGWIESATLDRAGAAPLFLAPSPANLPVAEIGPDHRRGWLAGHDLAEARRVLGFFGSPGAGKQFEWVLRAWRELRQTEPATALVVVGGRAHPAPAGSEARWCPELGYLPARAASEALQAMDILALPFVDGVSERRSSFMTGLAHGLPVVTRLGPASGRALREGHFFIGVPGGANDFAREVVGLMGDDTRRRDLGLAAVECYRRDYDWPQLARCLRDRLIDSSDPRNAGLRP